MARDWENEITTVRALTQRIARIAPTNSAQFPISAYQELVDGILLWTVDIHIKVRGETEYEVTGVDESYTGALRRAYLGMSNEIGLRAAAIKSNKTFGVAV